VIRRLENAINRWPATSAYVVIVAAVFILLVLMDIGGAPW